MKLQDLTDALNTLFNRLSGINAQLAKAQAEIARYPVPRTDCSIPVAWYADPGFAALWGRR